MNSRRWISALVGFVASALGTEATPLIAGTGAQAKFDWSFFYVTMKFIVIPAASLMILAVVNVSVWRNRRLLVWPAIIGSVALLYLVVLFKWPLFLVCVTGGSFQ